MSDVVTMWEKARRRRDGEHTGSSREGSREGTYIEPGRACLSDLFLDRLAQGQCSPAEREAATAHLQSCRTCAEVDAAFAEDRSRFAREVDVPALASDALARASRVPPARSRALRWLAPLLGLGVAAAAAGTLFWARPGDDAAAWRSKGGPHAGFGVELFVKHAEEPGAGRLHLGEALHPGDQVRLRLEAGGPASYLAVLAVDTAARVSVYYPTEGATTPPGDPAQPALPNAIELDATLGGEVILAFRCPQPLPVQSLVDAVRGALDPARVGSDPAAAVGRVDTPCVTTRYRIDKVAGGIAR